MADDIDEVALNVLLVEGLDPATALEASRRSCDEPPPNHSNTAVLIAVVTLAIVLALAVLLL